MRAPEKLPLVSAADIGRSIIDRHIQRYLDQQIPRPIVLGKLLAAGWPLEQLKPRFPELPESAFRHPEGVASRAVESITTTKTRSHRAVLPPSIPTPQATKRVLDNAVSATEGISFQYVPLIQCSFPHADPKDATTFTRKNGWLELTLGTTRPDGGLPYGVPARLLTIY